MEHVQTNGNGVSKNKGKKRKNGRKSRFLQKAKKFGKQGKLGRGFEVDSQTYDYFLRILELGQKNEFDTPEDKDVFISNAFGETEKKEVELSSNQMISRVIEILLPSADANVISRFTSAFIPNFRTVCCDPFASHVLEKLLEVTSDSDKWEEHKELVKWYRNTCKYVLNNFEEFVFNNYANHIMRKVCQCLSGTVSQFSKQQTQFTPARNLKKENSVNPPEVTEKKVKKKDVKILKEFAVRFFNWPQFYDLVHNDLTSCMIQCLLQTVKPVDEDIANEGVVQIMKALPSDLDIEKREQLHLIEVCLSVANESVFELLFNKYLKGRLVTFGIHNKGNYTLRKLISCCPNKEIFQTIYNELSNDFPKIYEANYASIFAALAEMCKKLQTEQSSFVKKLADVLGYGDEKTEIKSENFALCLSRLGQTFKPKEDGTVTYTTDINGTIILQHLLSFHKPHKVVSSLLSAGEAELTTLSLDSKGSHVMDSYFKSTSVGDKNKDKMIAKLEPEFVAMACSKFGSRVLDTIWKNTSLKNKAVIAGALSKKEAQLNSNQFAKFLATNCGVHLFAKERKMWEKVMTEGLKRKNEAEQLLIELGIDVGKGDSAGHIKNNKAEQEVEEINVESEEGKAESRKKKKRKSEMAEVVQEMEDESNNTPKKKSKKQKTSLSNTITETEEEDIQKPEVENGVDVPTKKKKSKKHKKQSTEDSENGL